MANHDIFRMIAIGMTLTGALFVAVMTYLTRNDD